MHRNYYILYLLLVCAFTACTPRSIREAQSIVAQADSLWHEGKMYGIDEGDSATLAQAYETLNSFVHRTSSLGTFSHACYHYGKLLRAKEDPVSAMQVFINAMHSRTHDYHILGRVYSNMGDICHLAGEYPLSYDMFERSADMFLRNGDTLLYYYGLNSMAFELAEQGKKEETLTLLSEIENHCTDNDVLAKVWETRVVMYEKINQQDSVIQYTSQLLNKQFYSPTVLLNRAKAYSFKGAKDSAIYYATLVLTLTDELYDKNNAMYILTNDDESKSKESIRKVAADRSDIQMRLKDRQGKLSQAVQLLDQDLHRKPDYQWLYAILLTLVVGGASIYAYIHWKRRQHALLSQQVNDLAIQNKEAEAQHEKIIGDIEKHKRTITDEVEQNCKLIIKAESFPQNIYWNKYKKMCIIVDKRFYMLASKLHTKYKLNETETRLCVLTLLDCKYDLIADLLYRSNSSIGTLKIRVAKKLGTTAKDLRMYLIENECVN